MSAISPRLPRQFVRSFLLAVVAVLVVLLCGASSAFAASSGEIKIVRENGTPQNSGAPTQYTINISCSGVVTADCGEEPTIRIPLDLTNEPLNTPSMETWAYGVSSGITGLVTSKTVEGGELVIRLNAAKFLPGESDTIQLSVTPPNGTTPNGTEWSLAPTLESSVFPPAEAPTPATGAAKAETKLSVSKNTADKGTVYVKGGLVTFNITAQCSPGASTGKLFMTEGSLVDPLPPGLEYIEATPAPSNNPAATNTIEWDYAGAAELPEGCGAGSTGKTSYQVVARILESSAEEETNEVTFEGTPIDEPPKATSSKVELRLIGEVAEGPGIGVNFLQKSAQAPVCIEEGKKAEEGASSCYLGTYPGHWIRPINPTPALAPGSAEGRFQVTVAYPVSGGYETDLADPMPCLEEEKAGKRFASQPLVGAVNGVGSIPACAEPAFNPTVIRVDAPSLESALRNGWTPLAILGNGQPPVALTAFGPPASSAYFEIPEAVVGEVAAIELPPSPRLTDNSMTLNVFGYAAASLEANDAVEDIATASAYANEGELVSTSRHAASIYIEPTAVQLGISKSFGGPALAEGGRAQHSTLNLTGSITVPVGKALPGPVVLADLLPAGMTWSNPSAIGANFTLNGEALGTPATVTHEANYGGSGRELIRVSIPAADFEKEGPGGFFVIKPPNGFFVVSVTNETSTFNNSSQIFATGIGRGTPSECRGGEGEGTSIFQSSDPENLSGDGVVEENFCEAKATLSVTASGAPNFALKKFVKGELDTEMKGALGVGKTNRGGKATFTLEWINNGTAPLRDPVVYDILPYVGDTGVDAGQAGNARDSAFATSVYAIASPNGVTVESSESTNPCREEVYAHAPGCVEDWTTAAANPKSIRFKANKVFLPGDSFTVTILVELPSTNINEIAWNSAATDANTFAGVQLVAAEPPKVGIEAVEAPKEPTISTKASATSILPERKVSDAITVAETDGVFGQVSWKLLGPVMPEAGSCEGVEWTGAAEVEHGTIAVEGDATYATPETELSTHGCYGYEATVEGAGFVSKTSPVGAVGETVLVKPAVPTLSTKVVHETIVWPGGPVPEIEDAMDVEGTQLFPYTRGFNLFGPVAPIEGSCEGVDWTGAHFVGGMLEGPFVAEEVWTSGEPAEGYGCYGFEVTIQGEHIAKTVSPLGTPGEVVQVVRPTPTLTTSVSQGSVLPGAQVSDGVTVAGTLGATGTVDWWLKGPLPPATDGSCVGVDLETAKTVAEGELEVLEDGTQATPAAALAEEGCYGYEEAIEGEHLAPVTSHLGVAGETILVHKAKPTLSTSASPGSASSGAQASDQVTVGGTGGLAGTVRWLLLGPVAAHGESCEGLDWNGAAVVAQGQLPIGGDASLPTPPTALTVAGCYGYQETVEGPHLETVTDPLGAHGETVLIKAVAVNGGPAKRAADLTLVKRVDQAKVEFGKPLDYTIEVTNTGGQPATNVVVRDTPRTPLDFVSAKPSRGTCGSAFPLACKVGTLAPGAKATVDVVATPTAAGKVVNDATVSSPSDPGAHGVKAAAASHALVKVGLSKTVTPRTVVAGGLLHYAIAVSDPTAAPVRNLKVCDHLPAGLTYLSSNPKPSLREGSFCWRIAALGGHAKATIHVVARALAGSAGRLVNTARVSGAQVMPAAADAAVRVKPRPVREGGVTG